MQPAFEFDKELARCSLPGEKWGRYAGRDILPLWVADMDFEAPPVVLEALRKRIDHGVFGYTGPWPSLVEAVVDGILRDHGWQISPEWIVWLPGVVTGLNLACRATGQPGSAVFTATPVYPPFLAAPGINERRLVTSSLVEGLERWEWDRSATEAAMSPDVRLLMLCNPHNPVGRIFDHDELTWLAELAECNDMVICSDEIHCGLTLDASRPHVPVAMLAPEIAKRTITLMAPSKTWNIPGLYCAFAIIPDSALRQRFAHEMRGIVPQANVLGMVAAEAAYRDGDPWRQALISYLRGNRDQVMSALEDMPGLKAIRPEATYLAWIDCRETGLTDPVRHFEDAGVGLSDGAAFGAPGFVRLNFGCTRSLLADALSRMKLSL